jgi:hypothetical protein
MEVIEKIKKRFEADYTATSLKFMVIAWALFIIFLAIAIDNKVVLAGILAYEVLP